MQFIGERGKFMGKPQPTTQTNKQANTAELR
jgi:hypothetical protein